MNDPFDPYAAPRADLAPTYVAPSGYAPTTLRLDEARAALAAHLANPTAVALDRKNVGRRLRGVTVTLLVISVLAVVGAVAVALINEDPAMLWAAAVGAIFLTVAVIFLVSDLMIAERHATAPDRLMRSFLRACRFGRNGFAHACLAPTARAMTLVTPQIPPVPTLPVTVVADTPGALTTYLKSFAITGGNQQRYMRQKRVQLLDVRGDLATVEIEVRYEAVPMVAVMIGVAAFVVFRPLIILYLGLYYALRKHTTIVAQKALLRGSDGQWYLLDADPTRTDVLE